jgi:hypothetical protein
MGKLRSTNFIILSHNQLIMRLSSSPLIVDFPVRSRHNNPATANQEKSLRFSEYSEMTVFIKPDIQRSELYYTPEDKVLLKQQLLKDAVLARMAFDAARDDVITEDRLCLCVGLECALSNSHDKHVRNHRRYQHIATIVSNQDTCTPEELCQMSLKSSMSTRKRAHRLAVTYSSASKSAK